MMLYEQEADQLQRRTILYSICGMAIAVLLALSITRAWQLSVIEAIVVGVSVGIVCAVISSMAAYVVTDARKP